MNCNVPKIFHHGITDFDYYVEDCGDSQTSKLRDCVIVVSATQPVRAD